MNRSLILAGCAALSLTLVACSDSGNGDMSDGNGATPGSGGSAGTVTEQPTAPLAPVFDQPSGFEVETIGEFPYPFAETYEFDAYRLSGAETEELIYVVSYLLPEDLATGTPDEQFGLVRDYDEVLGNIDTSDADSIALVNGYQGVFRFAKLDEDGTEVNQRNTFVFSGPYMVQITCQWVDEREPIQDACFEVQTSLELPGL